MLQRVESAYQWVSVSQMSCAWDLSSTGMAVYYNMTEERCRLMCLLKGKDECRLYLFDETAYDGCKIVNAAVRCVYDKTPHTTTKVC